MNWTVQISPELQALIAGDVDENGMTWTLNDLPMPKNKPHVEPPGYIFHGTLNPVHVGDVVDCFDQLTFTFDDGEGGTLTVGATVEVVS